MGLVKLTTELVQEHSTQLKHVGDIAAVTITFGALMQWIPVVVALLNGVYILMRIYDWVQEKRNGD